ncbi:flagellar hook-length control protein FliK [Seohaeicola saemankumensis]|uniref:flagellar hook-length control protein FliK n=1 Tax=Seohaeicola saemankumensis TaxID=481181 RepID=UPI001E2C8D5E|nr:flagellar hook-length control protein FliK [Seohaeicola saemankumensis]MCD1625054.1 flagellar hook-length control protein FliK [Seohaeicola saemankumensis]
MKFYGSCQHSGKEPVTRYLHIEGDETFGGQKVFLSPQMLSSRGSHPGISGLSLGQLPAGGRHKVGEHEIVVERIDFSDVLEAAQVVILPAQSVPAGQNDVLRIEEAPDIGLASVSVEFGSETDSGSLNRTEDESSFTDQIAWVSGETVRSTVTGATPVTDFALEQDVVRTVGHPDDRTLVRLPNGSRPLPDFPSPNMMTGSDKAVFLPDRAEAVPVSSPLPEQQSSLVDGSVLVDGFITENLRVGPVLSASTNRAKQISIASDIQVTRDTNSLARGAGDLLADVGRFVSFEPDKTSHTSNTAKHGTLVLEDVSQMARSNGSVLRNTPEMETGKDLPATTRKAGVVQLPVSGPIALPQVIPLPFPKGLEAQPVVQVEATEPVVDHSGKTFEQAVLPPAQNARLALPVTITPVPADIVGLAEKLASTTPALDASSVEPLGMAAEAALEVVGGQSAPAMRGEFSANPSVMPRMIVHQIFDATLRAVERPVDLILDPQELGKVRISMVMAENGITISILAERPETLDLIRRHIDHLAHELRQIGYGTIGFTFGQHNRGRDSAQAWTGAPEVAASTVVGVPSQEGQGANQRDAGLDIRV